MAISSIQGEQQALGDEQAAHVRFTGTSAELLQEKLPELGDSMTFTVTAVCVQYGHQLRKDGEKRLVLSMEVTDVRAGEITRHTGDPQLPLGDGEYGDEDELDDGAP